MLATYIISSVIINMYLLFFCVYCLLVVVGYFTSSYSSTSYKICSSSVNPGAANCLINYGTTILLLWLWLFVLVISFFGTSDLMFFPPFIASASAAVVVDVDGRRFCCCYCWYCFCCFFHLLMMMMVLLLVVFVLLSYYEILQSKLFFVIWRLILICWLFFHRIRTTILD